MALLADRLAAVFAKYRGHPEFLGLEIADPNQRGAVDDCLLHVAARTGAVDDIEVLVQSGARVNEPGDLGNTPLHHAAMMGNADAVEALLKLGARRDVRNEFGQTPEKVAELGGRAAVAQMLRPGARPTNRKQRR
jgi:ankyrin repeat protein